VYDKRGEHRGVKGLRHLATRVREKGFAGAYCTQRAARVGILLWLAGVPKRVGFKDSLVSFLFTTTVAKPGGGHDVLRNLALVEPDLDLRTRNELLKLHSDPDADVPWADLRVPLPLRERLSAVAQEIVCGEPYDVLVPGSAWETKRWDPQGFREVARARIAEGRRVVVVGAPADSSACEIVAGEPGVLNLCGRTSLEDLIAIIASASSVVCNDSLALHIASAVKVPVTAIFCATSPRFGFGPWRTPAAVVEKGDLFCKPCRRHGSRRCPTGTNLCMTGVSSGEVLSALRGLKSSSGDRRRAEWK
jgi:heptosyltransferase-2